jgi:hypothetical protein
VISWFNRLRKAVTRGTAGPNTTTSTSAANLSTGGVSLLQWADADALCGLSATVNNDTAAKFCVTSLYLGGVLAGLVTGHSTGAGERVPAALTIPIAGSTDTLRVVEAYGAVQSNTGSWENIVEWIAGEG